MRGFRCFLRTLILCSLFSSIVVPICLLRWIKSGNSTVPEHSVEDLHFIKHRTEALANVEKQEEIMDRKATSPLVFEDQEADTSHDADKEGDAKVDVEKLEDEELPVSYSGDAASYRGARSMTTRKLEAKIMEMKDLVVKAKAYLYMALQGQNGSSPILKELKLHIKDVERAMTRSIQDSHLSRSSMHKKKALQSTISKVGRVYPNCASMIRKLRAMIHSSEAQIKANRNQEYFLRALGGRSISRGQHCLLMRLTSEYFAFDIEKRSLPNRLQLTSPDLYHFAIFSDNVLACAVVVNSAISASSRPESMIFHIVTDSLNLPSITMWFLSNPPGKATVQVESIEKWEWFSEFYNVTLQGEGSFDPRFTSELNHLRFFLPDLFPYLDTIVFLDHDVVVQNDLTLLWDTDMEGNVNVAVMTCTEGDSSAFGRMDTFINFTNPMVADEFDPSACTWAFGMNLFNLTLWREHNLSWVYAEMIKESQWFKAAGSSGIGWLTFYDNTISLDRRWHVLGLGYDPEVNRDDIEHGGVLHFNGIQKPWLENGIEEFKPLWQKHLNFDDPFLRECGLLE